MPSELVGAYDYGGLNISDLKMKRIGLTLCEYLGINLNLNCQSVYTFIRVRMLPDLDLVVFFFN